MSVADGEYLVRAGIRARINVEDDLIVVAEAGDGAAVLPVVRQLRPLFALVDVRIPAIDGIQATRQINGAYRPRPGS
jgi:DNA-binding NarL/FixJ family response regulator